MKSVSKKVGDSKVELSVSVDADEMKAIVKDVEKVFLREVRIPGFRPGKAPLDIVRRDFADGIRKETVRMLVQRNLEDAILQEKLDRVAVSEVKDVKVDSVGSFTAVVEVKPVFKLPSYKGLKVEKRDVKVTDEELEEQIARLRAAYAKYEDEEKGAAGVPAAEGDFAQIDYSGTVRGRPIAEIAPDAKIVGSGSGFWLQLEDGRFLPEILDAVRGMKVGETKEGVEAKFGKENAPEGLKGAKAVYTVTLKALRHRILPEDGEFAAQAGAESYEKLVETMREQMTRHAEAEESARRETAAIDLLLRKADFDVPESQIRSATDAMIMRYGERAQQSGISAEYFKENRDKIRSDAETAATRQVRLWYVLEAIAKAEGIAAGEGEDVCKKAMDFVLANAK